MSTSSVPRRHCDDAGRDYAQLEKAVSTGVDRSGDQAAGLNALRARLRELAALGFDHVMVSPSTPWTDDSIAALASLLPEAHELTT